MTRRAFIALIGGAAAWPLAARAQQAALPVVGFLSSRSPEDSVDGLEAFHRGLKEGGALLKANPGKYSYATEPVASTPEQFAAHMRAESEIWKAVVRDANIKVE